MKDRWFVNAPEGIGFETFETFEEAKKCMDDEQKFWTEDANEYGQWSVNCDLAFMGKITHKHELVQIDEFSADLELKELK